MKSSIQKTQFSLFKILLLAFFSILITGCASGVAKKSEFSGYLGNYDNLQERKLEDGSRMLNWISDKVKTGKYNKVVIDPVTFYPTPKPGPQIRATLLSEIKKQFDKSLKQAVSDAGYLSSKSGANVLRVRPAITGVNVSNEELAVYEYIPIAFVFAGASTAAGTRDKYVQVFLETEVTDSLSGEHLASAVRKGRAEGIENSRTEVELKHVRPIIDKWSKHAVEVIHHTLN